MDHYILLLKYLSNHMHSITIGYIRFSKTNSTDPRQRVPLNKAISLAIMKKRHSHLNVHIISLRDRKKKILMWYNYESEHVACTQLVASKLPGKDAQFDKALRPPCTNLRLSTVLLNSGRYC